MVATDVRRRILERKHFRLVTSAATALATILELTLGQWVMSDRTPIPRCPISPLRIPVPGCFRGLNAIGLAP